MELLTRVLQATGLFMVTNIDDLVVLSLFFARGAGTPGISGKIAVGQYLGFSTVLATAVVISLGAETFLPQAVFPYFGLIPLTLGLFAAGKAWRGGGDDAGVAGKNVSALTVAGVALANGGDTLGVYAPVFVTVGSEATAVYSIVFLVLVAALVMLAKFIATRRLIAEVLERWGHVLFPLVLIGLGVVILVNGGAFNF